MVGQCKTPATCNKQASSSRAAGTNSLAWPRAVSAALSHALPFFLQPHPGVFGSCSVAPSYAETWWPQVQYSALVQFPLLPHQPGWVHLYSVRYHCLFVPLTLIVIGHLTMPAGFQRYTTTEVNKAGFVALKPLQELPAAFVSEYNALKIYIPFASLLRFSQREITCWFFGGSAAVPFDSCCTSFWISAKALFILLTLSAFAMFICRQKKKNSTHQSSKLKLHWHHFCTTVKQLMLYACLTALK